MNAYWLCEMNTKKKRVPKFLKCIIFGVPILWVLSMISGLFCDVSFSVATGEQLYEIYPKFAPSGETIAIIGLIGIFPIFMWLCSWKDYLECKFQYTCPRCEKDTLCSRGICWKCIEKDEQEHDLKREIKKQKNRREQEAEAKEERISEMQEAIRRDRRER